MAAPQVPQAEISSGRAARDDPAARRARPATTAAPASTGPASISSLTWNGHEYFGQWFERYDPKLHDAIMGPVEEFLTGDSGLGYDEAKPGETFVRIGVGAVRKPDEPAYRRFDTYEIVDPGEVDGRTRARTAIEFMHELGDTDGYAYVYRKTLRLDRRYARARASPEEHRHEAHRDQRLQPQLLHARQPADRPRHRGAVSVRAEGARAAQRSRRDPRARDRLPAPVRAEADRLQRARGIRRRRRATTTSASSIARRGAGVRITGDRPLSKLLFWSAPKTVCPEPYIDVSVEPGQESAWRIVYEFYNAAK